jgi:hypothetical protein
MIHDVRSEHVRHDREVAFLEHVVEEPENQGLLGLLHLFGTPVPC